MFSETIEIKFITNNNGQETSCTISKDVTSSNLEEMLNFFLKILYFQTFTYIDDLVAVTEDYECSAYLGRCL
jgi:hypothetical protein